MPSVYHLSVGTAKKEIYVYPANEFVHSLSTLDFVFRTLLQNMMISIRIVSLFSPWAALVDREVSNCSFL